MFHWLASLFRRGDTKQFPISEMPPSDWWGDYGAHVSAAGAMTVASVWQAVSSISGDLSKLPLELYTRTDEGRERAQTHPAYRLVKMQPTPALTAMQFWRRLYFWSLIYGQGFAWIIRDGQGRVRELIPLPNHCVDVDALSLAEPIYRVTVDGQQMLLPASQVLHITWLEWEDACAVSTLAAMQKALKLSLESEGMMIDFFGAGAASGGILELPASMSKKSRDAVEEGFSKKYEGRQNWFKTVILRDGAKFHRTTITAQESQTNELREDQVREIARFYNLPPARLGLSDAVSYNSLEQANRAYVQSTLEPWMRTTEQQCWLKLLGGDSQATMYFEYNTAALLRADIKTRYDIYSVGISNGILSPNECRRLENMNDREGGDVYVNPNLQPGSPIDPETVMSEQELAEATDVTTGEENERSALPQLSPNRNGAARPRG